MGKKTLLKFNILLMLFNSFIHEKISKRWIQIISNKALNTEFVDLAQPSDAPIKSDLKYLLQHQQQIYAF